MGRKPKVLPEDVHEVPDGCQWAKHCSECPWSDCVLVEPRYSYYTSEALRVRINTVSAMWEAGVSPDELCAIFHVGPATVYGYLEATNLIGTFKARRNAEIIQAYRESSVAVKELAEKFGIHERTVREIVKSTKRQRA